MLTTSAKFLIKIPLEVSMKKINIVTATFLLSTLCTNAWAQVDRDTNVEDSVPERNVGNEDSDYSPDIQMRTPTLSGSGCPRNTSSVVLSLDNKQLSILFDDFLVEASKEAGTRQEKFCNIQIPVQVPSGFIATIERLDYRGFNSIPRGGVVVFENKYTVITNSARKPTATELNTAKKVFMGPLEDDFHVVTRVGALKKSNECGKSFYLNMNTSLKASTNRALEQTLTGLDSIDGEAKASVKYHLRWKRCEMSDRGGDSGGPRREPVRGGSGIPVRGPRR